MDGFNFNGSYERLFYNCFNGPCAGMLIFGKKANEILKSMHDRAKKEGYFVSWVENPNSIDDFWKQVSSGIGSESSSVNDYRESLITKGFQHHLHIPDFDEVLYKLDVRNNMSLNASLKKLWFEKPDLLHIYGSYGMGGNGYIDNTLKNRDFILKKENFCSIEDIYFMRN